MCYGLEKKKERKKYWYFCVKTDTKYFSRICCFFSLLLLSYKLLRNNVRRYENKINETRWVVTVKRLYIVTGKKVIEFCFVLTNLCERLQINLIILGFSFGHFFFLVKWFEWSMIPLVRYTSSLDSLNLLPTNAYRHTLS